MFFTSILIIMTGLMLVEWFKPNEILHKVTFFVSAVLIFIMIGFNRMNADYMAYFRSYTNNDPHNEIGYNMLVHFLNALHLPFESILMLMAILVFLVFYFYSNKQHASFAALMYLVYPLALDLPQFRNLFMYMIVLLTLYLVQDRNRILLAGGFILSSTFHYFGLAYLPFTWLIKIDRKKFFQRLLTLFLIFSVGSITSRIFQKQIPDIIGSEISEFDWFYFMIQVMHVLLDIVLISWVEIRTRKTQQASGETGKLDEMMFRFSWYTIIELPLVAFSNEMYRFRRNAQLIKYIYSANAMKQMTLRDRLITVGLISVNLIFVVYMLYVTGDLFIYSDLNHNLLNFFFHG